MYTQCEHCKAIFHVNMREVTIAKGYLRCGECLKVFKASKTLSTTVPDKFEGEIIKLSAEDELKQQPNSTTKKPQAVDTDKFEINIRTENKKSDIKNDALLKKKTKNNWPTFLAIGLFLILISQVLYHYKNYFLNTPIREPEKIQMVTHNIFVHPKETGVLLITATISNTANHPQPYPILELSLNDSQSTIVALRRFRPEEYLKNYTKDMLLPSNTTTTLKLKIKDPGTAATRFQFSFL